MSKGSSQRGTSAKERKAYADGWARIFGKNRKKLKKQGVKFATKKDLDQI